MTCPEKDFQKYKAKIAANKTKRKVKPEAGLETPWEFVARVSRLESPWEARSRIFSGSNGLTKQRQGLN